MGLLQNTLNKNSSSFLFFLLSAHLFKVGFLFTPGCSSGIFGAHEKRNRRKCLHCDEMYYPDPRTADPQRYCSAPECKQASKRAAQRQWRTKLEKREYFKGPDQVAPVQEWRKAHPGYWRKTSVCEDALQDDIVPLLPKYQVCGQSILGTVSGTQPKGTHETQKNPPSRPSATSCGRVICAPRSLVATANWK